MRRPSLLSTGYLVVCFGFALRALTSDLPESERWLALQGWTYPWGVAISYLPSLGDFPELLSAAVYLAGAGVNAWLLAVVPRRLAVWFQRVERLDESDR